MTKNELIRRIASEAGETLVDTERMLNTFCSVVTDTMAKGDRVSITGFGAFEAKMTKERSGRNPHTGEQMTISARRSPKFTAAKNLKDNVN